MQTFLIIAGLKWQGFVVRNWLFAVIFCGLNKEEIPVSPVPACGILGHKSTFLEHGFHFGKRPGINMFGGKPFDALMNNGENPHAIPVKYIEAAVGFD